MKRKLLSMLIGGAGRWPLGAVAAQDSTASGAGEGREARRQAGDHGRAAVHAGREAPTDQLDRAGGGCRSQSARTSRPSSNAGCSRASTRCPSRRSAPMRLSGSIDGSRERNDQGEGRDAEARAAALGRPPPNSCLLSRSRRAASSTRATSADRLSAAADSISTSRHELWRAGACNLFTNSGIGTSRNRSARHRHQRGDRVTSTAARRDSSAARPVGHDQHDGTGQLVPGRRSVAGSQRRRHVLRPAGRVANEIEFFGSPTPDHRRLFRRLRRTDRDRAGLHERHSVHRRREHGLATSSLTALSSTCPTGYS